jgi:hypothetical protein|tara:strand:+ start:68 stop:253 length:186 start_codon:yes stop_codon:yes gene_type:complete
MDDRFLKTIIFIMKDKKTKKPIVITHFQGFQDDDEAADFSDFLKTQFVLPTDYPDDDVTIH